jgi:phosphosulfolactate synthase
MNFMHGSFGEKSSKPRKDGLTQAVDKFQGLDKDEFDAFSGYVDIVKIRWGLPLIVGRDRLKRRIGFYHDRSVQVSTGGTLCELVLRTGKFSEFVKAAASVGFDIIELSDATFPVKPERFRELAQEVRRSGLEPVAKAGRKDPARQLSPEQLTKTIERGLSAGSRRVVIESGEGYGVGIFRPDGTPNWELVEVLAQKFGREKLLFEAPLESQQAALILHFGPGVNLGAVELSQVASLESMRIGVRAGETFGMRPGPRKIAGSPAVKFVYHLVSTEAAADQTRICQLSGMPRRTVQKALESLERAGLVSVAPSLEDTRRKVYRVI